MQSTPNLRTTGRFNSSTMDRSAISRVDETARTIENTSKSECDGSASDPEMSSSDSSVQTHDDDPDSDDSFIGEDPNEIKPRRPTVTEIARRRRLKPYLSESAEAREDGTDSEPEDQGNIFSTDNLEHQNADPIYDDSSDSRAGDYNEYVGDSFVDTEEDVVPLANVIFGTPEDDDVDELEAAAELKTERLKQARKRLASRRRLVVEESESEAEVDDRNDSYMADDESDSEDAPILSRKRRKVRR